MQTSILTSQPVAPNLNIYSVPKGANIDQATAEKNARKVAEEFEASFLSTYIAQMFSGLSTEGPFGGGYGEEVYRSMMTEQYGKLTAANGGIGIADSIYSEILRMQEDNQ